MHRLNIAILSLWLALAPAYAQVGGLSFPGPGPRVSGGAAFTGILDVASIPTPVMAFSASHCPKSSSTTNLVDVWSVSNGAKMATLNCSSGGVLGVLGGSTWTLAQVKSGCTATHDCFAGANGKIYDISGALACTGGTACDATGLTTTTAPWLVVADGSTSCGSGSTFANANTFCFQTNTTAGCSQITSAALGSAISQPITYLFTYATLSAANQADLVYNTLSTVRTLSDIGNTASELSAFAGGTPQTLTPVAEAQWHTAQVTFGASPYLQADNGTPNTTSSGSGTIASGDTIGVANAGGPTCSGQSFFGFFGDIYVFKTTSISTAAAAAYAVEKAYYGGGMP